MTPPSTPSTRSSVRYVVLGAGAIGGVVGARLAGAGHEVVLIARGAHGAAIRDRGLRIASPDEDRRVSLPVFDAPAGIDWRAGDVVLLAVKLQDADAALAALALAARGIPVVCLTNGLEAERLAARHGFDVHGACVWMPASHLEPGVVRVWSAPVAGVIDVGRYPDGVDDIDRALAAALGGAGIASVAQPDIMRWKRGKLLANLGNAIEALTGPEGRRSELANAARDEAIACLSALGLSRTTVAEETERRSNIASRPIGNATRAGGSTWQSLARGAPLETDYLNGEIVLLGRLAGVPTPINAALQALVAEAARAGAAPGALSIAELTARVHAA